MREPTKEERESVNNYIKSISEDTGINFYDLIKRQDAINLFCEGCTVDCPDPCTELRGILSLPTADRYKAYTMLEDGTLCVPVEDGDKITRVLVSAHKGTGGLFYKKEDITAEWDIEISGNGWNDWEVATCSNCGTVFEKWRFRYKYCPECGRRMLNLDKKVW